MKHLETIIDRETLSLWDKTSGNKETKMLIFSVLHQPSTLMAQIEESRMSSGNCPSLLILKKTDNEKWRPELIYSEEKLNNAVGTEEKKEEGSTIRRHHHEMFLCF